MSDIDAIRRELADAQKRLAKLEAAIERLLAEPRTAPTRKPLPPHYSAGDPLGR